MCAGSAAAQTTSGNSTTGNTLFNSTANCTSCHTSVTSPYPWVQNASNAGGIIIHANAGGMGGSALTTQQFSDIAAYIASVAATNTTRTVTFNTATANTSAGNIAALYMLTAFSGFNSIVTTAAPARGAVSWNAFAANSPPRYIYTPDTGQCGADSFSFRSSNGTQTTNIRTINLNITNPSPPVITSGNSASGTYNVNPLFGFYQVTTSGGTPLSYSASGLPPGVSINSSSGLVDGTPTAAGVYAATINARNCLNGNLAGQQDSVSVTFTIAKANQTLSFSAAPSPTYSAGGTFSVNATATSGLAESYSSLTTGVCTVNASTGLVTIVTAGTCTIAANQAGNANYNAAAQVTQNVTIAKANQTITFNAQVPSSQAFSASTFAISPVATATSGLAISYGSSTPAVCTVSGTTVTKVAVGTCTLTADQAGNVNYNAAAQKTQNVGITQGTQTIVFGANPGPLGYSPGGNFAVSANGGASGNPVVFSSQTPGVCTIGGSTVTIVSAGTCAIAANQAGNSNYAAATQAVQNIAINQAAQTVSFAAAPTPVYAPGGTFSVSASATSGLAVVYSSLTAGVCTVPDGTIGNVNIVAAGTCTIAGNQPGNVNYNAAPQATQNIGIGLAAQAIGFGAQAAQTYGPGGTFAINPLATGGASGNAIVYSSLTTGICTVSGTTVTMVSGGTCTLAANQAGNANYSAAPQVTQNVSIGQAAQTITFGAQAGQTYSAGGNFTINPVATATSGLPIVYSSLATGVCTVSGITVTIVAAGTCTIAANQAGNASYGAAPQVTRSVAIGQASQSISFGAQSAQTFSAGATFMIAPAATATSGLAVSYASLSPGICTVSGGTYTIVGAGTCIIAADQAGNANFLAAPQVTQNVVINKAGQTITFGAQPGQTFSAGASFMIAPVATASSGLAVSYASLTPAVCTVSGGTYTIVTAGTCTITANQAGDANYSAAMAVSQNVIISPLAQVIAFGALPGKYTVDPPFGVSATGGASGNPVTFSSSTMGVCTTGGTNGATVTLTGNAGTCTITANQAGATNYVAAMPVAQSFGVAAPTVPGAPVIGASTGGNGIALIGFTPPASNGGAAITGYVATCLPGGFTGIGAGSPVTVTGLANGVMYSCSVAATNAVGTGAASASVGVTPTANSFVGAESRKLHGVAGNFNLALDPMQPIGGNVTVEPRLGPAHLIVFRFSNPVGFAGMAAAVDGNNTPLTIASFGAVGAEVHVTLSGVADASRATISLTGVDGALNVAVSLGFLAGDVNGSKAVNASDIALVKARFGQAVAAGTFLNDLNASGALDANDVAAVKARAGRMLP